MLIPLSDIMQLKTCYIQQRGLTYQFVLRVPAALVARYGTKFIRISLRTTDAKDAIKKAEPLARKFLNEFENLKNNERLTPSHISYTAKELAESYESLDAFIDYVIEPKRRNYAKGNEEAYRNAKPEKFLTPLEQEAADLLEEGLDAVRLDDAHIPPRRNHKVLREYDQHLYRGRHLAENAFLQLKRWRGVATRYAKNLNSFLATVHIRCIALWTNIN